MRQGRRRHPELTQTGEQLGPSGQRSVPNPDDCVVEAPLGEQARQVLVGADNARGRRHAARAEEAGDASPARHGQIGDRLRVSTGAKYEKAGAVTHRRALEMGALPCRRISSASRKSHSVSMLTAASNPWTIPRLSTPRTRASFIKTSRRVT